MLNARLSQLKGSSEEFHILRTAHHEGSFEDRWPQAGSRGFIDHPSIIEKFAEVIPPNDMTPAFVEKLRATEGRVSDLMKDSQQLWLENVKSFSVQMKEASTTENIDLPFAELSASSFAKSSPEENQAIHSLVQKEERVPRSLKGDRDYLKAIESEVNFDEEMDNDLISQMGAVSQTNIEESTEMVSFYVDNDKEVKEVPSPKKKNQKHPKKAVKRCDIQNNKRDVEKLNALFNKDLDAYINMCISSGMVSLIVLFAFAKKLLDDKGSK